MISHWTLLRLNMMDCNIDNKKMFNGYSTIYWTFLLEKVSEINISKFLCYGVSNIGRGVLENFQKVPLLLSDWNEFVMSILHNKSNYTNERMEMINQKYLYKEQNAQLIKCQIEMKSFNSKSKLIMCSFKKLLQSLPSSVDPLYIFTFLPLNLFVLLSSSWPQFDSDGPWNVCWRGSDCERLHLTSNLTWRNLVNILLNNVGEREREREREKRERGGKISDIWGRRGPGGHQPGYHQSLLVLRPDNNSDTRSLRGHYEVITWSLGGREI